MSLIPAVVAIIVYMSKIKEFTNFECIVCLMLLGIYLAIKERE